MNFNDLTLLSVGRLSQTNRFIAAAEGADPTLCHAVDKVDGVDGTNSSPNKHVWLYPTAAISAGDWVAIAHGTTTNGLLRHIAVTSAATDMAFGVAEEAASAASTITPIKVCVAGVPDIETANVTSGASVAVGDPLIAGSSGRAVEATAKDGEQVIGWCLTTPSSNTAQVCVRDRGWFG